MAKTSGLGDNLYVGEYNLSGDINAISNVSGGVGVIEVTSIDKYAHERIGGQRTGAIEFQSYFNKSAGQAHPVLAALPTTDRIVSYFRGQAIGNPAASMVAKQINYDGNRANDGDFKFTTSAQSNGYGLEWGLQGTAGMRTDTAATVGAALDSGAATTNFGLQVYYHLIAFDGVDITIKLQESSDNGADTYANVVGATSGALTAVGSARIATATNLAVERYLKVVTTTTGGFNSATFAVVVVRNAAEPKF